MSSSNFASFNLQTELRHFHKSNKNEGSHTCAYFAIDANTNMRHTVSRKSLSLSRNRGANVMSNVPGHHEGFNLIFMIFTQEVGQRSFLVAVNTLQNNGTYIELRLQNTCLSFSLSHVMLGPWSHKLKQYESQTSSGSKYAMPNK